MRHQPPPLLNVPPPTLPLHDGHGGQGALWHGSERSGLQRRFGQGGLRWFALSVLGGLSMALPVQGQPLATLPTTAPTPAPTPAPLASPAAAAMPTLAASPGVVPQSDMPAAAAPRQPEAATGSSTKPGWATKTYAVAAANPLATQAGRDILRAGGSAVDAAIAVQMVLSLVEPQSSGIGGGAFLLHFDGRQVQAFDGRETAPAAATPALFLNAQGKPMAFAEAAVGGRSVGVPGVVPMLALAHAQHGKLPWAQLFDPAIRLARQGFPVSARMARLLATEPHLAKDPVARAFYFDAEGKALAAGHVLQNPELAEVLSSIAKQGPTALMQGPVAQAIVKAVQGHASNPGHLTLDDLAQYRPEVRRPTCFDHAVKASAQEYRVCGMPAPSSGTIAIGQILGMLNRTPAAHLPLAQGLPTADWLHLYTEAARLAFADRALYLGDPAFVQAPAGHWESLLAPAYLAARAASIDSSAGGKSMRVATAGTPLAPAGGSSALPRGQTSATLSTPDSIQCPACLAVGQSHLAWATPSNGRSPYAPMPEQAEYGTSHISIIDAYGHALAMTTTIEDGWGARLMVNRGQGLAGGFLLNNQLTDFSFLPQIDGKPVANRVEPGKRPRSSMAPVLVFDRTSGNLVLSTGSPGGALIIHYTAKALYAWMHWGLNAQEAIKLPNFASLNGPTLLEEQRFPADTLAALRARDHVLLEVPMPSGLQAISRTPTGWFGGADPRREGLVLGD